MSDADDPKRILSDVDTVYANYLLTCRRLGIEPVPRDRAGLLVAAWRIRDNHWTIAQAKAERDLYDVDAEPPFDEDKMLAEFAEHANA